MSSLPDKPPVNGPLAETTPRSPDQTARIVHKFVSDFVVRSAVEQRGRDDRVLKAWHEAASAGR
jgi:hypothetical protein